MEENGQWPEWPDFVKLAETLIFGQKWPFLDHFYPLKEAKIDGQTFFCKKVKLRAHTLLTSHHKSKLDHFWAHYLQKMVKKPYNVTTCNVFLTKKGPKPDFSRNFHLFFFKSKPKMQFQYAKLRRSYNRISKISRNVDFWPKMAIFYQNGPKTAKRDFLGKKGANLAQQVRLAIVPRDSQHWPQLYQQLTWNSD